MIIRPTQLTTPLGDNYILNSAHQVLRKRSHCHFYLIQLGGFVARHEAKAHCLQVDAFIVMQAGDGEGLGDPRAKSFPLELAHPRHDIYGTGRKRAGSLRPRHLQVIEDHPDGSV